MKYIVNITIFIIGFILGALLFNKPCKNNTGDIVLVTKIDTFIKEKVGTIEGEKPSYVVTPKKEDLPKNVQEVLKDSDVFNQENPPVVREFITHFKDSVIDAKSTSYVIGELLSTTLDYKFKEITIYRKDSVTIFTERNKLLIGLETSISSPIRHISPTVEFYHKSKWAIQYRYELNTQFGNTHNIGVKKVISLRNNKKN